MARSHGSGLLLPGLPLPIGVRRAVGGGAPANPLWPITLFQSGFEGTDGQTSSFLDDTGNWTLTAAGGRLEDSQKEYGATSAFAPNTTGGWITGASASWGLSAANSDEFFIEFSVYYLSALATYDVLNIREDGGNTSFWGRVNDTGEFRFLGSKTGSGFTVDITTSSAGIAQGSWKKVAIEKNSGGTIRIYVGGVMRAKSTPADSILYGGSSLKLKVLTGGNAAPQEVYMDNVRILKGTGAARVDSDSGYTPETGPFPIG